MSNAEKAQCILNAYQALADGRIEGDTFAATMCATMRLSATTAVDAMMYLLEEIGYIVGKEDGGWIVMETIRAEED